MKYQDCVAPAQAPAEPAAGGARLTDANINARTGLATDYLNHFNEAIMLLEMLSACPDCVDDFLAWRPMSYREHFEASRFKGRELAIAAYDTAPPDVRDHLDALAATMTVVLEATRAALGIVTAPETAGKIAGGAAASLKPLIARAGAVINGEAEDVESITPQTVVDGLMKQMSA
jgi:hypothetical protein